ncbi:Uncharacterized protein TCM_014343 [Theobroma cacao]|uniref:Gag-pro-like protein n=1 Tax=Theobroma cacao TaxID=3641 RepID=A0A061G529_THECC|nr:Uncharacterized protein TCM_014343 [Theobroma cacao]
MEGTNALGSIDALKLTLIPRLVIPPKVKVPDFEKYDSTKCLMAHVTMYCHKMAAYTYDDNLLIHCFQDSLTRSTFRWYNKLN